MNVRVCGDARGLEVEERVRVKEGRFLCQGFLTCVTVRPDDLMHSLNPLPVHACSEGSIEDDCPKKPRREDGILPRKEEAPLPLIPASMGALLLANILVVLRVVLRTASQSPISGNELERKDIFTKDAGFPWKTRWI